MKVSFYNNVVKNRRMLLERSARDISRYTAGKPSMQSLFPTKDNIAGDVPSPQNVRNLFSSVFSSIEEPYTIFKILEELNKITDKNKRKIIFFTYQIYDISS